MVCNMIVIFKKCSVCNGFSDWYRDEARHGKALKGLLERYLQVRNSENKNVRGEQPEAVPLFPFAPAHFGLEKMINLLAT